MKLRALIVEDEKSLLELLKFNFVKDCFAIDTATCLIYTSPSPRD